MALGAADLVLFPLLQVRRRCGDLVLQPPTYRRGAVDSDEIVEEVPPRGAVSNCNSGAVCNSCSDCACILCQPSAMSGCHNEYRARVRAQIVIFNILLCMHVGRGTVVHAASRVVWQVRQHVSAWGEARRLFAPRSARAHGHFHVRCLARLLAGSISIVIALCVARRNVSSAEVTTLLTSVRAQLVLPLKLSH